MTYQKKRKNKVEEVRKLLKYLIKNIKKQEVEPPQIVGMLEDINYILK